MADTAVAITAGAGTNIDTRTEGSNGNHRQVVVLGDPATNDGVCPVDVTAGVKVNLGADNDVTVTGTVTIQDGGNTITVDGTVATTQAKASTATLTTQADSASSVTLKALNASRLSILIVNDSTVSLFVKYGTTATSDDWTYKLQAGESWRESEYTGRIDGIWESDASGKARITEFTA